MRRIPILCVLALVLSIPGMAQRVPPYQGSRIFWDLNSQTTVFSSGNYARMIQLQDGRLMAVAEAQGGVSVAFSSNMGKTWTAPQLVIASPEKIFYAVPDLIQLTDGTILVGYNPRPREPYTTDRLFGIRVMRSVNNGDSWEGPYFIFDAQYTFNNGCWEPAFLELPSGEVQCYFANENEYTTNSDQNISMCRSFDRGLTWSEPVTICYRQGARDGMPAPILLQDSSEIVVIIEDNGWSGRGNFATTTVRNTLEDNWTKGYVNTTSPNRSMIFQTIPPTSIVSAAPYLRKLPWGETVASYQSNERRTSLDLQYFDMYVLIGDERARNFKAKSAPFSLGHDKHSIWNSVSVVDTGVVVALGSIGVPNGRNDVVMIKGYPIRQVKVNYGTITVDGTKENNEKWTTPNASQLFMGNVTKNTTTIDFLYDECYLYLTARVVDRNLINTGSNNDGLRFFIDANDVSGTSPQTGMYNFFFDTDGTVNMKRGEDGLWKTETNTGDIRYSVSVKSMYYNIEAAIPWSVLGKITPPVSSRIAIAIEVVNKEQYTVRTEVIPDVDNNASWTWLEFKLSPHRDTDVTSTPDNPDIVTYVRDNILHINSTEEIETLSFFSLDGKLLYSRQSAGSYMQIPLSLPGGRILSILLKNDKFINKKLLF